MRAELEVQHSGEQFWVNSFDNTKIDCMVIPSKVVQGSSGSSGDNVFGGNQSNRSFVSY